MPFCSRAGPAESCIIASRHSASAGRGDGLPRKKSDIQKDYVSPLLPPKPISTKSERRFGEYGDGTEIDPS
ncbi:hypothetical protein BST61_g11481 [Cercospora zeina]